MPDWKEQVRTAIAHLNLELGREDSIVEEFAEHLEEKYNELLGNGLVEEEAHRAVMEELSKSTLEANLRPVFRPAPPPIAPGRVGQGRLLSGIGKDLQMAARVLWLNPGFAVIAILSLALGVGANTAIFELIDAVVLRTLPVPDPQRLANVVLLHEGRIGSSVARQHEISSAIWEQLQQQQQAFSSIAAWSTEGFNLGHGGEARNADGLWVSGSFFDTLQISPVLGRLFSQNDDRKGCGNQGVVISYSFWQSEFGGRGNALGATLSLDRHPFQIIGITPPSFSGLEVGRKFDVALPLCSEPSLHTDGAYTNGPTVWWLAVIGRLRTGWQFDRASAELSSISPGIFAATLPPAYDAVDRKNYLRFSFRAVPAATGVSQLRKEYEYPLYLLLAISGLVLLIACANIANLMLVRASARQHEMALRLALGASRGRLIRQLLIESLMLAMTGTCIGAMLAFVLSKALIAGNSTNQDQIFVSLSLDWRVLVFTAGLAILSCVVFGIAPALQNANAEPGIVIKTGGRGLTGGRQSFVLRRGFIISQMAFSLVLVVAALLFIQTFGNLANLNPGFDQEHILVAGFDFSPLNLPPERRLEFKHQLLEQVRAIPGVVSAADAAIVPLGGNAWNEFIDIPGTSVQRKLVNFTEVSPDYFRTMAVPMLAGRDFNDSDLLNSPPVAIANQAFAKTFLGSTNSASGTFGIKQPGGKAEKIYRIIGVVGDTKYRDIREKNSPILYVAESQDAAPDVDSTMLIHSNEELSSLISSLKNTAAKDNPEVVLSFSVLRTSIRESLGRERLMAALSGYYGALAAILSAVGLYGVMSYTVSRRRSEIGIRMALGATRGKVLVMIMREALTLLTMGLALGTILVIVAGRSVQAMLFGLKPTDPLTLGLAMAGMTVVALAASLLPAQRAAAVQPIQTLREE